MMNPEWIKMAVNRHLIDDFLRRTEEVQESIINHNINNPGDDPEDRIMNRYTRDLQLITTRGVAEMAKLGRNDSVEKGITWIACAMMEGVAAITAALVRDHPGADEDFINHFRKEMVRARKLTANDDE
jgi:hypothetical protein